MADHERRLRRQFDALARRIPPVRRLIEWLLADGMRAVRLPAAFLFIFGGLLFVLPGFGIWMLPLGLMLLAVDTPLLRPFVSGLMIRVRRRLAVWRRR